MSSKTLTVQVYSRGKELYGLTYPKSQFNEAEFLERHQDDYYELSGNSVESEVPVEGSYIYVALDGHEICHEAYKDGSYYQSVKVVDSDESESYCELLCVNKDEIGIIWFHDYVNTKHYTWENIDQFDPSKLCVHSIQRIDETDNSQYRIVSHLTYNDSYADDFDFDGSPKAGFFGPWVLSVK